MKSIRKKLNQKELKCRDIDSIKSKIKHIVTNKQDGYREFSEDDIEQLDIIKKLLRFYEEGKREVNIQSRGSEYNKAKIIVDELSLNQIISNPLRSVGGQQYFQINDLTRYRNYLYKLIELIIDKVPKKAKTKDKARNSLNHLLHNNGVRGICVVVIGGIILALILPYILPAENIEPEPSLLEPSEQIIKDITIEKLESRQEIYEPNDTVYIDFEVTNFVQVPYNITVDWLCDNHRYHGWFNVSTDIYNTTRSSNRWESYVNISRPCLWDVHVVVEYNWNNKTYTDDKTTQFRVI
jgi:hypothetical protein